MQQPPLLKPGDSVGILSTARKITPEEIEPALNKLEEWELQVELGETIGAAYHQWAGDAATRAQDLQQMLNDKSIKAILCARGGNGTIKMVDHVDFSLLPQLPKWIVGFSDVTVLHSHINRNYGLPTLHALMPLNFPDPRKTNKALQTLYQALFEGGLDYTFPSHELNRTGEIQAPLIGGNLSTLYSLIGSRSEPDFAGKILFLEEVDEHLYHVDRMLTNLKRSGKLARLKGIVIGGLTAIKDDEPPYGFSPEELVRQAVEDYNYPLAFNLPAGHVNNNCALYLGQQATLTVSDKESRLAFT